MVNGIRTVSSRKLDKKFSSKFRVGSRVRPDTPEEGRRMHQPKRYEYKNKDEDNCPNTLNDKRYQASTQKFKQINTCRSKIVFFWKNPSRASMALYCLVRWGCRIYRLHLCRGVRPLPTTNIQHMTQSDGGVPVILELWGMRSTPSLSSPLGPL